MQIIWVPVATPLSKINPVIKAYLLLFVILIASFFSKLELLILTSIIVLIILFVSKIPAKLLWQNLALYLILLIPFISFLSFIEYGFTYFSVKATIITYIRFVDVIIMGIVYSYTTNPTDISIILLSKQSTKKFGIALSAGFGGLMFLEPKIKNIFSLQQIRGINLSFNPFNIKKTYSGLKAIVIPIILQSIDISQDYANAMIARGYNAERKITLPPHLKVHKQDTILLLFGTFYLIYVLYYNF